MMVPELGRGYQSKPYTPSHGRLMVVAITPSTSEPNTFLS